MLLSKGEGRSVRGRWKWGRANISQDLFRLPTGRGLVLILPLLSSYELLCRLSRLVLAIVTQECFPLFIYLF